MIFHRVTLLKKDSNIDIFLEYFQFLQKTQSVEHTELSSSDLETLSWYLIEKPCCIVFQQGHGGTVIWKSSPFPSPKKKKMRRESSALVKLQAV